MTMGDMIVLGVLVLITALVIRGMLRDKKQGKCCGCSGCREAGCCAGNCSGCTGCSQGK